jgi:RNA polymerase sigma factor (sigma-70 family)
MRCSLPVLTAVLLGLGVPPAGPTTAADASSAAVISRVESPQQSDVAQHAIDAAVLRNVGDYLRAGAAGSNPSPDSKAAWRAFFPACDRLVRQYSARFKPRGVDPEDCAQEVWSQLLRTLPTFQLERGRGQFNSWLFAVVRSKANDILRRSARQPVQSLSPAAALPAADGNPLDLAQRSDAVQQVKGALATLRSSVSPTSYRVLHLRHIEQLSVRETAKLLSITPQQVWARDHRMRSKLRELLKCR